MATVESSQNSSDSAPAIDPDRDLVAPSKLALMLGFLGFLAFVPVLGNDFVAWDDPDNFLDNIGFRGLGWNNVRWAWGTMIIGVYQPIAWMLLEFQYLFTKLDPYGYHLASALMHGLNAMVLFSMSLAIAERCRPDLSEADRRRLLVALAFSVAIFIVHPMRTEVVAWASAQPYLPCAFFAMLSVITYLKANPPGGGPIRSRWLLLTFVLYAAAILSKAAAIPMAAVYLVLDVYPLKRVDPAKGWKDAANWGVVVEKAMFFVLCAVFMVAAVVARVYDRNLDPIGHTGITGRISLTCYSAVFYPFKSLVPDHLHAFYMRPVWEKLFSTKFLIAMAGTVAIFAVLFRYRRRVPGLVAAWAVYLVILAPVSGVITTGMQVAADRYAYLTMMAFVVPVAIGLLDLSGWLGRYRLPPWLRPAMASGIILGLMALTFVQCRTWKDSEALWSTGIQNGAGHVADLHNNLGAVWASRGHFDLAIVAFNEALRIRPGLKEARRNLDKAVADRKKLIDQEKAQAKKGA